MTRNNAVAESFNSTLEFELLSRRHFVTREQARRAVAAFIDEYNTDRSFLGLADLLCDVA